MLRGRLWCSLHSSCVYSCWRRIVLWVKGSSYFAEFCLKQNPMEAQGVCTWTVFGLVQSPCLTLPQDWSTRSCCLHHNSCQYLTTYQSCFLWRPFSPSYEWSSSLWTPRPASLSCGWACVLCPISVPPSWKVHSFRLCAARLWSEVTWSLRRPTMPASLLGTFACLYPLDPPRLQSWLQ